MVQTPDFYEQPDPRLLVTRGVYKTANGTFEAYSGQTGLQGLALLGADGGQGAGIFPIDQQISARQGSLGPIGNFFPSGTVIPLGTYPGSLSPVGSVRVLEAFETTRHAASYLDTFTVVGATTTHTLTFNRITGAISGWNMNQPSTSIEADLLNTGLSFLRGLQPCLTWHDDLGGKSFTRHTASCGDMYSDHHWQAALATGGIVTKQPVLTTDTAEGGERLAWEFIPIELDPGGFYSLPAVDTDHGGGIGRPVFWHKMRFKCEIWINARGVENVHELKVTVDTGGFDAEWVYWDGELCWSLCANRGVMGNNPQLYDPATGLYSVIVPAGNYQTRWDIPDRASFVDDVGSGAAGLTEFRGGYCAAAGVVGTDLTILLGQKLMDSNPTAETDPALNDFPRGNMVAQMQVSGSGTVDSESVQQIKHGSFISTRFHDIDTPSRTLRDGATLTSVLIMGTRTNTKALADQVL